DRSRVSPDVLYFDETLCWEEDYDFLIRVCASACSDFGLRDTSVGEYYYKTDGSNTVLHGLESAARADARDYYVNVVQPAIERTRRRTCISPVVRKALMLDKHPTVATIEDVLRYYGKDLVSP